MITLLLIIFYLFDEILNKYLPVSSGSFIIVIILIFLFRNNFLSIKKDFRYAGLYAITLYIAGLIGGSITHSNPGFFSAVTILLMVWLWSFGKSKSSILFIISPTFSLLASYFAVTCLYISVLFGFDMFFVLTGESSNRPCGLYSEPSHLALYLMPLLMISWSNKYYRKHVLFLFFALAYGAFSLTLILCGLVGFLFLWVNLNLINFSLRRFLFGLIKLSFILFIGLSVLSPSIDINGARASDYVSDRVIGLIQPSLSSSTNLSSLVFLQGIELAFNSLIESYGLGVGLGNMGFSEEIIRGSLYHDIILSYGIELNLRDGSFLFSKLVAEIGLLSLIFILALIRAIKQVVQLPGGDIKSYYMSFLALAVCILFVRSLPYFAAPTCLALLSISSMYYKTPKKVIFDI